MRDGTTSATRLRGYDRSRVDQFRDQVADELERLSRANQELEVKARNFHEQLRAFRERDKALNDALISAQQLRGEIREQAQREAQLIIREAQGEAERSLDNLRSEIRRAEDELQQLWRNRRSYLVQLRSVMERELAALDNADMAPPPSGVAVRASDAAPALRAPVREAAPEPTRDVVRERAAEPTRESVREPVRESAPDADSMRELRRELSRDMSRETATEAAAEMAPIFRSAVRESDREAERESDA